ncbi:MAG: hypothetical protein RMI79_04340 [Nitrososphaerota archaeon]|nr:hypothetical protein [Nitrososphaerota archaeon]
MTYPLGDRSVSSIIIYVGENDINEEELSLITVHEIGHSLGLQHHYAGEEGFGTCFITERVLQNLKNEYKNNIYIRESCLQKIKHKLKL